MSSSQSQSNAGHPDQPEPAGNFDQSSPPPGPDFVVPPEGGYSDQNPPPTPPTPGMYSTSYPEDSTRDELAKCSDIIIKNSIHSDSMRSWFSFLMSQLLLIFGTGSLVFGHEPTKLFVQSNLQGLILAAYGGIIVFFIGHETCNSSGRHGSPLNWIFRFIYTVAVGILLCRIFTECQKDKMIDVSVITTLLCSFLTMLAFERKLDLTGLHTVLIICAVGLLIFGIVAIWLPSYTNLFIFCPFGAILLSCYLMYDTEIMMDSQHKYSTSPEENKNNQSIESNEELSKKFI